MSIPMTAWGVEPAPGARADAVDALRAAIAARFGASCVERYAAPPVIARSVVERAGYPESFPQLLGAVHAAPGGGDPAPTDLVLTPAACHHIYPIVAAGGARRGEWAVEAACFRAEAGGEAGRLRSFRMAEVVRIGQEHDVRRWRDGVLRDAAGWLRGLGLRVETVPASDPFFGRPGKLLARAQQDQRLKWEITAPVADGVVQAVSSANCHLDHFGQAFGITDESGAAAHSACLAFGIDRLVLALRHVHGPDRTGWPALA